MNVNYAGLSMSWNEPLGAVSYEYQIAVDDQFLALVANETATSNSIFGAGLMPSTTYYWRVRASDGNVFGEYSETRVFTTNTLENFNLQTPANSAVDVDFNTVNFNWTSALGAVGYQLSYATDMAFAGEEVLTMAQSEAAVDDLNSATTYYWRVRATANGVDYGEWSSVWSFTTARPVGVGEIQTPTIQLYPNPVDELLTIELSNTTVPARVEITDMRGSLVYNGTQANASRIFVGHLNGGMYVVRVIQGEQIYTQHLHIVH
jgi:hypothetical protein